jgi:DNA-3-methyladenine glycosylase II
VIAGKNKAPSNAAGSNAADRGEDVEEVRLPAMGPFHLEATVRILQRRPASHEMWEQGRYLRVFATADGLALTAVANRGSVDAPDIRLSFLAGTPSAATRRNIEQTIGKMLGLALDPEPLHAAAMRLPGLRSAALALRGMRPPRFATLFDTFGNVVPFQQLSLDAGSAIVGRLVERFGERVLHGDRAFAAFPTASAVAGARRSTLLSCGLSRAKADSLRSLARALEAGGVSEAVIASLSTSEALKRLIELPGIGPWSAAVVMLRGFGRLEVFPPGDSGAQRGLNALLGLRTPASLARVVQRFGDYRGYLYLCGLGGSLLAKGLIQPADS